MGDFIAPIIGIFHRHTEGDSFILIVKMRWLTAPIHGERSHVVTNPEYLLGDATQLTPELSEMVFREMHRAAVDIYATHALLPFGEAEQLSIGVRQFGSDLDLFLAGRKQPVWPPPNGSGMSSDPRTPERVTSMPSCRLLLSRYLSHLMPTLSLRRSGSTGRWLRGEQSTSGGVVIRRPEGAE